MLIVWHWWKIEGISINDAFNNPWCAITKDRLRMKKPVFLFVSLNCYIHSLQIVLFSLSLLRMPQFKVGGGGLNKYFDAKKKKSVQTFL